MIVRMHLNTIKMAYAISNKLAANKINKLSSRIKQKQSVEDVHNLQDFLTTQIQENKLYNTIHRTSKYDDGFDEFLTEYKKKHKNILDLTHYAASPLNKTNQLREEEFRQLQAFLDKRKKQLKDNIITDKDNLNDDFDPDTDEFVENKGQFSYPKKVNRTGFKISDQFFTVLIDRDTNTQVTTLQRINSFRQLIFIGNGNGVIGYGKGKGKDFQTALIRAKIDAKRNLVPISLDLWHTCPIPLTGRFNDAEIEINPRPLGFNAYGNPQIASMLMLTGIHHCSFKVRSRNQVPYSLLYAFMQAVTNNTSAEEVSEACGMKIYRQNWGKKIGRTTPLTFDGI
ncbi:unnamed protein product [Paramecium primaurelia]|uniref:Small ribosomal subunit protein uS5 n=1 Tax=Paramecium primaurelia TaxID=5886 RepID=A0A8S1Q1C4_PARPR|nr:unnamed protein product [Paramecium primaurelia]